jgi:4-oxalocrotonate tautomerase
MALVHVKLIENALSSGEKRRLIERLTDATAAVVGHDVRPYIWVLIEELSSGCWGIDGTPITTDHGARTRGVS